jgi:hypothetical protein
MTKSQDEPDDGPDGDIPWADPAIRTGYENALGRFILAFNEVDYRLSQVITSELSQRGRSDLSTTASKGPFAQRIETLDILASTTIGILCVLDNTQKKTHPRLVRICTPSSARLSDSPVH